MTGYPMRSTPAELALLALMLAAPINASAQDASLPDAALLEFLAEWDEADPDWLDAELNAQLNPDASVVSTDDMIEVRVPPTRTEKSDE